MIKGRKNETRDEQAPEMEKDTEGGTARGSPGMRFKSQSRKQGRRENKKVKERQSSRKRQENDKKTTRGGGRGNKNKGGGKKARSRKMKTRTMKVQTLCRAGARPFHLSRTRPHDPRPAAHVPSAMPGFADGCFPGRPSLPFRPLLLPPAISDMCGWEKGEGAISKTNSTSIHWPTRKNYHTYERMESDTRVNMRKGGKQKKGKKGHEPKTDAEKRGDGGQKGTRSQHQGSTKQAHARTDSV